MRLVKDQADSKLAKLCVQRHPQLPLLACCYVSSCYYRMTLNTGLNIRVVKHNVIRLARVAARYAGEKQNPEKGQTEEGRERCENKKQRWSRPC